MTDIAWKYKGPGYYYGIPASDLTEDEFKSLPPEYQATVREAPEYTEARSKGDKDETGDKTSSTKKGGE